MDAKPSASFYATPVQGCNPLKVDFINTSSGAVGYLWKFGNGNESTIVNPGAVYNVSGKFTVTLIAIASNGSRDTSVIKDYINVFNSPISKFDAISNKVCKGDSLFFTDKSIKGDGNIVSWTWDFGDGGTSYNQNPRYFYTLTGKYDVTLAVLDNNGCQHSLKMSKYASIEKPPTVSFTSNLSNKCKAPLDVKFTGSLTGSPPYNYLWDFGDGNSSTAANPSHIYSSQGSYSVKLIIKDNNNCIDSQTKINIVNINPPIADFTGGPTHICLGEKTSFNNLSTPLDGTGSYLWDYGNGSTSTEKNGEIVYSKPGVYTVTLSYTWDGCVSSKTRTSYITVYDKPSGKISPRDTIVCKSKQGSLLYQFIGNNVQSTTWEINGMTIGNFSSFAGYSFPTQTNGTFKIVGHPFSSEGCRGAPDTITVLVRGPNAAMLLDSTQGCIPYSIKAEYSGSSAAPIVSYKWSGLGKTGNGTTMNFTKTKFGEETISLKVVDTNGCEDETSQVIDGGLRIEPVFETIKKICRNQLFTIYNNTPIRHPDTVFFKYSWDEKDTIKFEPKDSVRLKLKDTPEFVGYYTFISISHGCTTGLDKEKRLKVRILGPKLEAGVHFLCDRDSFAGINTSTHFTRTFWRFVNPEPRVIFRTQKEIKGLISQTKDLWVFAYNDTNNCQDSMPFNLKVDPIPASFIHSYNCSNKEFSAKNSYPGLNDTNFIWTVTNTALGKVQKVISRNLKIKLSEQGIYKIELRVNNPSFTCTTPAMVIQQVFNTPDGMPSASVNRSSCYPVDLTLEDPAYNKWASSHWVIAGQNYPNDEKIKQLTFTSNLNEFQVFLNKVDSSGCKHSDTFKFTVGGLKAQIAYTQNGELCKTAVVRFNPVVTNNGSGSLKYYWNFGHKTSTNYIDTVQINGWRKFVVSLRVVSETGCESYAVKTLEVNNGSPKARFTVSDSTVACPPLNVEFIDKSEFGKYPIVSRIWDFGDSSYSDKTKPGKLYIYPGKYSVSLIVTNSIGCSDTFRIPELVVVKGPYGTYKFDKKRGCTPLTVALTTNIKGQIKKLEFDMGDGAVLNSGTKQHVYKRPGLYIPRLIVIDSNGCKFSPQPTDTIRVFPRPIADFDNFPVCDNRFYDLQHHSTVDGDAISKVSWLLNGESMSTEQSAKLSFKDRKVHDLTLMVTTQNDCSDTVTKPIRVFAMEPALKSDKTEYCLGETAYVEHASQSDTAIVRRNLWLKGVKMPDGSKIPVLTNTKGMIPADLIIEDAIGCMDTAHIDVLLKVGDTVPPPPLIIYRSSVLDNFTTETKFNKSLEPDFKKYNLYVLLNNQWQLKSGSSNINDTNLLSTGLNTLRNSYCHVIRQVNFCNMETDSLVLIPHCTVEIKARGDTNVSQVRWNPYAGWKEVDKYRIFRKKKDETDFKLLDSVPGDLNYYIDKSVYCHVVYDYKIEAVEKGGYFEQSWSDTARAKPLHHVPVPAPEVWRTTVDKNLYTHTEWITPGLHQYPLSHFSLWRNDGSGWKTYNNNIEPQNLFMDDYLTQVQTTNYTYKLNATDVCGTESPFSNVGRNIVLTVAPAKINGDADLTWTPYIYWNEGVEEYIIERSINGSEFQEIGRVEGEKHSFTDREVPKYCVKDFMYRVIGVRNQPLAKDSSHHVVSISNYAEFNPDIRFFIPNAYTPNQDNLNEGFKPDGIYYYRYEMRIYNRWGQKVYDGDSCQNAWNGIYNGEKSPEGVYAYYIRVWDFHGRYYEFTGTLHLLR